MEDMRSGSRVAEESKERAELVEEVPPPPYEFLEPASNGRQPWNRDGSWRN